MISNATKKALYMRVRHLLLTEATKPLTPSDKSQEYNRQLVENNLIELCVKFDPNLSVSTFWEQAWKHFRWAGIRADIGTKDVDAHTKSGVFSDYTKLIDTDWDYPESTASGDWGIEATKYLSGIEPYVGFVKNRAKLKKTVMLARALARNVAEYGKDEFLKGVFGKQYYEQAGKWNFDVLKLWHGNLCLLMGGNNQITAFHLMMDLGIKCVKPDIVLTDLFYRLGWLSEAGLRSGMNRSDVRKHYTKPHVYWIVQKVALDIADDIIPLFGENPVRELDWVMVKYGQDREPSRGICINLDERLPIERLISQEANIGM